MKCPKCGKQLSDDAKFCTKCGTPIVNTSDSKSFKWKDTYTYIMIAAAVVLAAAGGLVYRFIQNEEKGVSVEASETKAVELTEENQQENEEHEWVVFSEAENSEEQTDAGYHKAEDAADYDMLTEFGIYTSTIENYAANLEPDRYLFYDSGIGEFYFSYPDNLFNDVVKEDSRYETEYGMNLQTIRFSGSAGSVLSYSVYARNDGESIESLTSTLNYYEHEAFYDMEDILVKANDEKGRIVLAGVADADGRYRVYDLIKVDSDHVYRMLSIKPKYRTEEERMQYAYVTENEYRMCGFSGSTQAARSYNEYVESNQ